MAEPTEEEFPAEPAEGAVAAVDEEMLQQPEEEPAATGEPPVPKTDEEMLTGVYHQIASFYGGVDAAIVNEVLTTPSKCAFLRVVGPAAVAGRLMGGKAAKAAGAKLLESKYGKAAELPVRYFIRFLKPLPRLKSTYCGIVSYNFREQSACDAFLQQYSTQVATSGSAAHADARTRHADTARTLHADTARTLHADSARTRHAHTHRTWTRAMRRSGQLPASRRPEASPSRRRWTGVIRSSCSRRSLRWARRTMSSHGSRSTRSGTPSTRRSSAGCIAPIKSC